MLDINSTISQIDKLCRLMGQQYTVTRGGSTVGTPWGIVGKADTKNSTESGVSNLTVKNEVIYIPAFPTWAPRPGDVFTAESVSYSVVDVAAYRPGKLAIAYKVTVE